MLLSIIYQLVTYHFALSLFYASLSKFLSFLRRYILTRLSEIIRVEAGAFLHYIRFSKTVVDFITVSESMWKDSGKILGKLRKTC